MPWKTSEVERKSDDGQVAKINLIETDQAGNPIWIDDKGMETGQDVVRLRSEIKKANEEAAQHRVSAKELEKQLVNFEGIDPAAARKAIETVANLKDKEMLDANQIEQIKAKAVEEHNKAWEKKMTAAETAWATEKDGMSGKLGSQDQVIRNLMVRNSFEASTFIKEHCAENYFPEVLYTMFGGNFTVEPGENGNMPTVVAKINGEPIYSPSNPRQYASPEEAIEILVRAHPQSKHILRGSGAGGGGAANTGGGTTATKLDELRQKHAQALKDGNVQLAVQLKSELFRAEHGQK